MSKLFPVIHIKDSEQAIRNAIIAKECGCNGCFLIDHSASRENLLSVYRDVRQEVGDWWVGLNDLGRSGPDVFEGLPSTEAVWLDNLGIDESSEEQIFAQKIWNAKLGMLFGGVAFKYQKPVKDLGKVARLAANYCDVITTSGSGTGTPPSIQKIEAIKDAIGDKPMAIASGIDVDNVGSFLGFVEYFLVATAISSSFYELDVDKTKRIVDAVR